MGKGMGNNKEVIFIENTRRELIGTKRDTSEAKVRAALKKDGCKVRTIRKGESYAILQVSRCGRRN